MLDFIPKITSEDVGDQSGTFVVEPLDRALLGEAALALQEELHVLAPALLALGGDHPGHQTRLRFRGRTPL